MRNSSDSWQFWNNLRALQTDLFFLSGLSMFTYVGVPRQVYMKNCLVDLAWTKVGTLRSAACETRRRQGSFSDTEVSIYQIAWCHVLEHHTVTALLV
jgi:hypothetical protein